MTNPIYPIICTQGQWTKVATNVVSGQIWCMDRSALYFHTYRLTGENDPTDYKEGVQIFVDKDFEIISEKANEPIDIHIWCKNSDGNVRVDT